MFWILCLKNLYLENMTSSNIFCFPWSFSLSLFLLSSPPSLASFPSFLCAFSLFCLFPLFSLVYPCSLFLLSSLGIGFSLLLFIHSAFAVLFVVVAPKILSNFSENKTPGSQGFSQILPRPKHQVPSRFVHFLSKKEHHGLSKFKLF